MAMPSGNLVMSDKVQFPNGGGSEIHHPRPWFPDERDGFISWLRAEFAAANAIIDTMCHHLRAVGEPGEYDLVIGCVQQRRGAWSPILHMQQYFPITEIMFALQQVTWKKQQRSVDSVKMGVKEFKRSGVNGVGLKQGIRAEATREIQKLSVDAQNPNANASITGSTEKKGVVKEVEEARVSIEVRKSDDKLPLDAMNDTDASLKCQVDSSLKTSKNTDGTNSSCTEISSEDVKDEKTSKSKGSCNILVEKNGDVVQNDSEEVPIISPKTFSAVESSGGKMVNMAEGLNLYEKLLDDAEISKLIALVNDLRATGRRGQLPGSTFVVSKRPYRGHGREIIQFGVAISDVPSDDNTVKDRRVEPIPGPLQAIIDRLVNMQVTPLKPDSCVIDIFNEGDHSQPHSYPAWYGRPVCLLSLSDFDMVFGAAIAGDRPGMYRGSLRVNLMPGSLLAMQGNSTDIAKRAIPSIRKQRILITFLKPQPSKASQSDSSHRLYSQSPQPPSWGPAHSRPLNHLRPKHYTPPPPMRAQLPPPNGVPPLYGPPPVPTPMSFPASAPLPPGSVPWPTAAPRHPTPRVPVPGTGVFLPPSGSGGSPPPTEECNGSADESVTERVAPSEDQQKSVDLKNATEAAGTA